MQTLPPSLAPLAAFRQFVAYILVPSVDRVGKTDKIPVDSQGRKCTAIDPAAMLGFEEAKARVAALSPSSPYGMGVGFTFTAADPFFFLDVDGALDPLGRWSPLAVEICGMFPHAAVEVSQSGRGLHIIGSGVCPAHGCRNQAEGLELYTENRFVALTGNGARGSAAADCAGALSVAVNRWFPPSAASHGGDWTDGPIREGLGVATDDELLAKASRTQSAASSFGAKASFAQLWAGDSEALAAAYPDPDRPYDASGADASLAMHLLFWTGGDCERTERLMRASGLVRDKYEREDYLRRTIAGAAAMQGNYYEPPVEVAPAADAAKLRGSEKEAAWAERLRAERLPHVEDPADRDRLAAQRSASFWIDNREKTPAELAAAVRPMASAKSLLAVEVETKEGHQTMSTTLQREFFAGCVYVQSQHAVLASNGAWLDQGRFNATYGGYEFIIDDTTGKTTDAAWKAFTESRALRWPIAEASCFRPDQPFGAFVEVEGHRHVNIYSPAPVRLVDGDPAPFLKHLALLLPDPRDRAIALAYFAACVQRMGVKFQWAPLFQGAEGNGKTLFTRCVAYAVGERYVHLPPASQVAEKHNDWLFGKVLIGVEDVYVPEHKSEVMEVLKPMITNNRLAKRAMRESQVVDEVCANFILNSNHRDAIRKSINDRRFAVFFTAQQTAEDIARDGMGGDYFPNLYDWLKADGYAIVAKYLTEYPIPYELDPAAGCHRAPATSSEREAVEAGLGRAEQDVLEAIAEELPGFKGGWVSSMALDRYLQSRNLSRLIPHNKRREMLQSLGYDWHPSLREGRAVAYVKTDGGKPKLFALKGSKAAEAGRPVDVCAAYEAAQQVQLFSENVGLQAV